MFKKTLLALALTSVAGVANAGTLTVLAAKDISIQGNAVSATAGKLVAAQLESVTLQAGSDYVVNDLLVLTLSGATFDKSVTPTAVSGAATDKANFTFVDFVGDNTVRFRVSANDHIAIKTAALPALPGSSVVPAVYNDITLAGFQLLTGTPANGQKIQLSASAISVNPLIGSYDVSKAVDLATFVDQVSYEITPLNGVVATGKGRAEFVKTTTELTGLVDELTLAYSNKAGSVDAIIPTKQSHVIKGNFSYLADYDLKANGGNDNGTVDATELAAAVETSGFTDAKLAIDKTLSTLTITDTAAPSASSVVKFNVIGQKKAGSVIVAPQSFTIDSTVASATNSIALATASAGTWTLDGSSDNIELMPFGAEYAQSITVANRGTVEGVITVTLKADGKTYSKELTAKAGANTVTNISLEVAAFAAESGVTGNAHVNVIVNAPAANIGVKGVYYHKASADRVLTH